MISGTCGVFHVLGRDSLSHAFSCVLRVLFPLVKMSISLTVATASSIFETKGKIAFCASGYNLIDVLADKNTGVAAKMAITR